MRSAACLVFFAATTLTVVDAGAEPGGSESPVARDEPARREEVLVPGRVEHGGYGGPEARVTSLFQAPMVFVGAQGGYIMNHALVIGGAGYATARRSPSDIAPAGMGDPYVAVGYGGARVAFVLFPLRAVHFSFGTLVGGGAAQVADWNGGDSDQQSSDYTESFFVIEPEAALELNLWKNTRLAIAGSYRYVSMLDARWVQARDLRGPAAGVALKFGRF